jgi:hypothetical protein
MRLENQEIKGSDSLIYNRFWPYQEACLRDITKVSKAGRGTAIHWISFVIHRMPGI